MCEIIADGVMEFERRPLRGPARDRFRALLNLASESSFEGERQNAMAAATRLAEQHGMSLDEAARPAQHRSTAERRQPGASKDGDAASGLAGFYDVAERDLRADKDRRESALRDALERGLDRNTRGGTEKAAQRKAPPSRSKRSPRNHASVLLAETSFSLKEIVGLTGLDIYEVVGLKLKMRTA